MHDAPPARAAVCRAPTAIKGLRVESRLHFLHSLPRSHSSCQMASLLPFISSFVLVLVLVSDAHAQAPTTQAVFTTQNIVPSLGTAFANFIAGGGNAGAGAAALLASAAVGIPQLVVSKFRNCFSNINFNKHTFLQLVPSLVGSAA